jgi:glycosyltransferase involved in cell wall biosynthesis
MLITFFFRKSSPTYHSIEKLFSAIIKNLPTEQVAQHFSPYQSKGLLKRLLIGIDARRFQGDINHITGDIHFIALFLKKSKTILTIHDIGIINQGNFLKRFIIKFFWFSLPIKKVKYITVISEFTKREILNNFNVKEEKIIVINNCIPDTYKYFPKIEFSKKPCILQIGTKENKNIDRLIQAIENIDCKLIIVGKLNELQSSNLKQHNIDYENHFNISEQAMSELIIKCDILAYVSTYEGFGVPVVEANAVGRPVLASAIEPIKSVAGNSAFMVDPFQVEEIRNGIIKLLTDKTLCATLIENGLENARKYRSEIIAKEYMAVYQKLMESK